MYAHAVESEVHESRGIVSVLLPNIDDELAEFFDIWARQEKGHGVAEHSALEAIGLDPNSTVQKGGIWLTYGSPADWQRFQRHFMR